MVRSRQVYSAKQTQNTTVTTTSNPFNVELHELYTPHYSTIAGDSVEPKTPLITVLPAIEQAAVTA